MSEDTVVIEVKRIYPHRLQSASVLKSANIKEGVPHVQRVWEEGAHGTKECGQFITSLLCAGYDVQIERTDEEVSLMEYWSFMENDFDPQTDGE